MHDKKLLEEIKTIYALNKNIKSMVDDLEHNVNIEYWANKLCSDDFNNNLEIAEALFDEAVENANEFRDYKELAFYVGRSSGINDKDWAKELLDITITKITNVRDLRNLADALANKDSGYTDENIAATLYKECIQKASNAYGFYCIADSLCDPSLLNDKDWAKELYLKAIEVAQTAEELTCIADAIADEDGYNDETWANELHAVAYEHENQESEKKS